MASIARRLLLVVAAMLTALAGVLITPLPAVSDAPAMPAGPAAGAADQADQAHPAAAQAAEADPGVTVGKITLSRSSVAASGVATVPVTVTASARVTDSEAMDTLVLGFIGRRSGQQPSSLYVPLKRITGTPTDGVWRGVAHVGSVHDGTLKATRAFRDPCWTCGGDVPSIEISGPSLTVRGTHIPRLTITAAPDPVALSAHRAELRARVLDSDTGAPYAKPVTVWFAYDNVCVEYEATDARVTRDGVARLVLDTRRDKRMLLGLHCAYLYGPKDSAGEKVPLTADGTAFDVTSTVTIRPAARSVRVNRPLTIRGTIADANSLDQLQVKVQRLVGRSQWRTLATAQAPHGRYTATIRYGTRGRLTLRTIVDGQVRATSPRVVVTVV